MRFQRPLPPMNFFHGKIAADGGTLVFREGRGNGAPAAGMALRLGEPIAGKIHAYRGREIVMGMRPEEIAGQRRAGGAPTECPIEAIAEVVEPMGAETYLHLKSGGSSFVARVPGNERIEANQKLAVFFDMARAYFFDAETGRAIA